MMTLEDKTSLGAATFLLAGMSLMAGCSRGPAIFGQFRPPEANPTPLVSAGDDGDMEEGVALVAEERYEAAEQRFQAVLARHGPGGDMGLASEATFWTGFCREKRSRVSEAREFYSRAIDDYPGTAAAQRAAARLNNLPAPDGDGS